MPAPAANSPGPPITFSTLPGPADTDPWSLKSMKPTVALPAGGRLIVPVLTSTSGAVQHPFASSVAPGASVRVPELVITTPVSWTWTTPGPAIAVAPGKVTGFLMFSWPEGLKNAAPCTVSGAARVATLRVLTSHEKVVVTVTLPPESDASLRVRLWSSVPPGMPVTCGVAWEEVGPMVTLSPSFGTDIVSQLPESPQLVPSPFPVHVGSEEALAVIGASVLATIAPAVAATASPDRSQQPRHLVMVTPMARAIPHPSGKQARSRK